MNKTIVKFEYKTDPEYWTEPTVCQHGFTLTFDDGSKEKRYSDGVDMVKIMKQLNIDIPPQFKFYENYCCDYGYINHTTHCDKCK